jgi:hypothetical protein
MQIGIVAAIHEAIEPLQHALIEFHTQGVEVVVDLGDASDTFTPVGRSADVVALLRGAGAIGVWGNHDVGLCIQVSDKVRHDTDPAVLAYMATMRPQLVLADCRFSHVEPWLDATLVENLWYFDGVSDTPEKAGRRFAAVPERFLFVGHFHRWLVMTPAGAVQWNGERPLELREAARYLVAVAPVVSGWVRGLRQRELPADSDSMLSVSALPGCCEQAGALTLSTQRPSTGLAQGFFRPHPRRVRLSSAELLTKAWPSCSPPNNLAKREG